MKLLRSPALHFALIGIVAFARYADALCPLTLDHGNLLAILDQLEVVRDRSEDGTAVGEQRVEPGVACGTPLAARAQLVRREVPQAAEQSVQLMHMLYCWICARSSGVCRYSPSDGSFST